MRHLAKSPDLPSRTSRDPESSKDPARALAPDPARDRAWATKCDRSRLRRERRGSAWHYNANDAPAAEGIRVYTVYYGLGKPLLQRLLLGRRSARAESSCETRGHFRFHRVKALPPRRESRRAPC